MTGCLNHLLKFPMFFVFNVRQTPCLWRLAPVSRFEVVSFDLGGEAEMLCFMHTESSSYLKVPYLQSFPFRGEAQRYRLITLVSGGQMWLFLLKVKLHEKYAPGVSKKWSARQKMFFNQLLMPSTTIFTVCVTETAFCKELVTFGNPLAHSWVEIAAETQGSLRNMSSTVATLPVSGILTLLLVFEG